MSGCRGCTGTCCTGVGSEACTCEPLPGVDDFEVVAEKIDGYQAPETFCEHAEDAWTVEAAGKGITLKAFQGGLAHSNEDGTYVVAWLVDENEDCYVLRLSPSSRTVAAVYHSRAKKGNADG